MKSVYSIPQKIKQLSDKRQRKSISLPNTVLIVLICFILQYQSFHEIFTYQTTRKRIKHLIKGKICKTDAAREIVIGLSTEELTEIHDSVISKIYRNKVLRGGTIDGYVVCAVDGVELFASYCKHCCDCLVREHKNGRKEYFHKSEVCMTVGTNPHIILGQEMLRPRGGSEKDEGELTGGKRLIRRLYETHHHFADVIVADALYMNAPFINTVLDCHMDVVIPSKDEGRLIIKDAVGLFQSQGKKEGFTKNRVSVEVWDADGFYMESVLHPIRVLKFVEHSPKENEARTVWVVTTLSDADYKTIWKIIHKRWDIEENGFHQLKTYYNAKHCFVHGATENLFLLNILAFNIRELYLYRRNKVFRSSGMTRREVTISWRDDLLLWDCRKFISDA